MASLTHVCMWSDDGWKRITAEEAAELHPGGTVSACSGLFMCELCGQYVTLTDGDIRTRYFKHSAHEKSKDCPERTFGANASIYYDSRKHDLPIRIVGISSSSFRFELGLIRAPISQCSNEFCIEIKPKGASDISYVFAKERLNEDGITYLPIGEQPFETYALSFRNGNDKLRAFWPAEVTGIDPEGTLFEKASGRKLTYDADVMVGQEYYVLKRGYVARRSHSGLQIREIAQKRVGWTIWNLYLVSASELSEEAARFYLDFHCRLTENPVSLQPVWPLFVEGSYIIKHNQNNMYMLVKGDASAVRTFPSVAIRRLNHDAPQLKLYEVSCSGRQQLISAGRTQTLQYTYFWRKPLDLEGRHPEISVTDLAGLDIVSGETDRLPNNKTLRIKSAFDGEIIISNHNHIVGKRKIPTDTYVELDGLAYGLCVQIAVGLDVVWQIEFKKPQSTVVDDEVEIMRQIVNVSGSLIPVPHALRSILVGMTDCPEICQWIRKRIQDGVINEQSYRRLQTIYRNLKQN